jgi:hypothetical protein
MLHDFWAACVESTTAESISSVGEKSQRNSGPDANPNNFCIC